MGSELACSPGLGEVIADPSAKIEALHFYAFNQVESCEAWRMDSLATLDS